MNKILRIDDEHVLVGETEGVVEVIAFEGQAKRRVAGYQIDGETQITELIRLSETEYALCGAHGLYIVEFNPLTYQVSFKDHHFPES